MIARQRQKGEAVADDAQPEQNAQKTNQFCEQDDKSAVEDDAEESRVVSRSNRGRGDCRPTRWLRPEVLGRW